MAGKNNPPLGRHWLYTFDNGWEGKTVNLRNNTEKSGGYMKENARPVVSLTPRSGPAGVLLLACVFLSISFAAFFCFASKTRFQYPGTECMEDPAVTDGMYGDGHNLPDALLGYWNGDSSYSWTFCPISFFFQIGLTERDWDSLYRSGEILENQSEFFTPDIKDAQLEVHVWDNDDRLGFWVVCSVFSTSGEGHYDSGDDAHIFDWNESAIDNSLDGPQVLTFDLSAMDPTYEYFYLVCGVPPYVPGRNLPSQIVGYTLTIED